jgi:hypothetical protein
VRLAHEQVAVVKDAQIIAEQLSAPSLIVND